MMRYYDFSTQSQRPRTRRKIHRKGPKLLAFVLLFFVLMPIILWKTFQYLAVDEKKQTLAMTTETSVPTQTAGMNTQNSTALGLAVQSALEGTKGKYSVVVKNMRTEEQYMYKEHEVYQSGSLYKLWVMAEAMKQLQKGMLKESQVLTSDIADLNKTYNIASDAAELHDGSITVTVKQALNQMITISHNYAALLLAKQIKLSNVTNFLINNELIESKVGQPPKTSAYDTALFFEKLYQGKLADAEYTEKMLTLLKAQRLNNKLPRKLADDVIIAHKTGELGFVSHDAGIVYSDNGDYIIVVLTETSFPEGAEERIADISKAVYEYFRSH